MSALLSPLGEPRTADGATATATRDGTGVTATSGSTVPTIALATKKKRLRDPLAPNARELRHKPETLKTRMCTQTGRRSDEAEVVRRHEHARTMSKCARKPMGVAIDTKGRSAKQASVGRQGKASSPHVQKRS